jgi:phosphotransferase system  glucose/maltose/N-acetylglucosamine-specific IIC component
MHDFAAWQIAILTFFAAVVGWTIAAAIRKKKAREPGSNLARDERLSGT